MVVVYSFFLSVCLTNTLSAPSSVRELEIFFCGACFPLEAQFQAQGFPLPLEESFAKVMERLCCAEFSESLTAAPGLPNLVLCMHLPLALCTQACPESPRAQHVFHALTVFHMIQGVVTRMGKKSQMWFWCFRSCLLTGEQNQVLLMVKWP